jgi:hypothetical protein
MTRRLASIIALFLFAALPAVAQDFYWESPQYLGQGDSRFPVSATNGTTSAILFQEIERFGATSGNIWLTLRVYSRGEWHTNERFAGPFAYEGEIPSIATLCVDSGGSVIVAAATDVNTITIYKTPDSGLTFSAKKLNGDTSSVLSPRVFARADGGYLLFATKGGEDNFSLVYSRSDDCEYWTAYRDFAPSSGMKRPFLPAHAVIRSADVIVFQAFYEGSSRSSYQLYSTVSTDGGSNWGTPSLVTGFQEPGAAPASNDAKFENWHNQRARLMTIGSSISIVWERARTSSEKYAIYYTALDSRGRVSGAIERVSSTDGFCFDPDMANWGGKPVIAWFDNRMGVNHVYVSVKDGFLWSESNVSKVTSESVFGKVVSVGNSIEVFWQQNLGKDSQRVVRLAPDRTVRGATIRTENFVDGRKGRSDLAKVSVSLPEDSSGVAGYSWAWSKDSRPDVPAEIQKLPEESKLVVESTEDGRWFLGVRVADYAGNWSAPSYVEYIRDTTPPAAPSVAAIPLDGSGFAASNTLDIAWDAPVGEPIAGYSWSFDYLAPIGSIESIASVSIAPPRLPASIRGSEPLAGIKNADNGVYALSVSAIDEVGNVGPPSITYYALNKYIPYTLVAFADAKTDESGAISLSLIGRGFASDGYVTGVYIDRDGKAPWDIALSRKAGNFKISGDRLLTGITLTDVDEGLYRIAIDHPTRGLYVTRPLLTVTSFGTVKFGDYRYEFTPPWKEALPERGIRVTPFSVLLWSALAFALALFWFSARGIASAARDSMLIRGEVQSLITGDIMASEKKKRSVSLRNRGIGLRFKLSFFTTALVISVVLIVSIPLGIQFSANQEKTLAQGLQSRVEVLLDSLASGARAYLPSQNILELGFLPDQMSALSEAINATITGNGLDSGATGIDYVWATNDGAILDRIDTAELAVGKSRLQGNEGDEIDKRVATLDAEAYKAVGEMSEGIVSLTLEGRELALKTDKASEARRDEIQTITRQLEEKVSVALSKLSASGMGSWPQYDPQSLSRDVTRYVFYKPVLYRQGNDTKYVHGTVRVEISTESLLESITADQINLLRTTFVVALIAVLIGAAAALMLASIIISPVRKLAAHVAMIRDTEDKEELEGKDLKLRSRDEIGLLGETINGMTHGLVKAAAASKDLTVGKEVQKMFIPLETDSSGRKLTCGSTITDNAEFFGYYEGAKGVSGDYFDYIKLDDRHYAIIKCDVAGKGVPAALIMVEVATLFLDYFKDWTFKKNGYRIDVFVSRINDLIESRGFKGRFAAFTMCIFDSVSGDVHFCNAGDNLVHVYESSTRKMKTISLPEISAAGVFPSFMIDMKGGFRVVKQHLNPGDVLYLYTDGIEEAKRLFRTKDLVVHACAEPGLEKEAPHGSHSVGQDNEELGPERVNAIIEAVMERKTYSLFKWHNPDENETFDFNFTNCEGTVEESILALVSVEKIFRMYRNPKATDFDRVQVDRKVDSFLNRHFTQYQAYCGNRRDHGEYGEYLYYTNACEDSQYDDLTLLGIRKR